MTATRAQRDGASVTGGSRGPRLETLREGRRPLGCSTPFVGSHRRREEEAVWCLGNRIRYFQRSPAPKWRKKNTTIKWTRILFEHFFVPFNPAYLDMPMLVDDQIAALQVAVNDGRAVSVQVEHPARRLAAARGGGRGACAGIANKQAETRRRRYFYGKELTTPKRIRPEPRRRRGLEGLLMNSAQ